MDVLGTARASVFWQPSFDTTERKKLSFDLDHPSRMIAVICGVANEREFSRREGIEYLPVPEAFQDVLEGVDLPEEFHFAYTSE